MPGRCSRACQPSNGRSPWSIPSHRRTSAAATAAAPERPGIPDGIPYADLGGSQRDDLERLLRHYLDRARPEIADAEWARIRAAGLEPVTFAWAGPDTPGRGHYYAIRGPAFLIEYDNTQDGANHIHSVWRDLTNDSGRGPPHCPLPGRAPSA